ncbi:MAG: bifunctional 3-(3-hydroxy-phenyl)propionate/3-hydroxycinnamic acid hydroxylase [Sphingobium sp.]|uniref:bifunctional 3-(3-hydroxy-phenyl)propionate/3-hydroxycinnamic acid hydroxylase MhpA n=1 Tax=Sphingobium sp. TaxID=1912891 RepID=UPI0029B11FC8|nr:bifunctional 3-(3-hydroxy-phenyl)propionate/3-hydroxycinnamic acid hydroxylase [Sphingobium sp.]MDX3911727.1 bifunctional 3-(3-hydroxy-phenyl)propionate/3-hydroxycinnamic acid hydroxylase [Sphingobium sp.]
MITNANAVSADNVVEPADVLIVGAGPTGKLLALLLGRKGLRVIVVERHPGLYSLPRAIAFDDEIARLLADIGIDPDHDDNIVYMDEYYYLENGKGETIAALDWTGTTQAGHYAHYFFYQPALELALGRMIDELPSVTILRGAEVCELNQSAEAVEIIAHPTDEAGNMRPDRDSMLSRRRLTAKFLVGADGANSFVRRAVDLPMTDLGFHYDWLIVDVMPKVAVNFRSSMLQICDPARPVTLMPGGGGRRRWEFMVLPGEDLAEMNTEAASWRLLQPWKMTPENATLERHTVWRFQAKWADQWRSGRVLIAGDAAHLMPPFAGQGMCAGLRDAVSLAWRLDLVLRGESASDLLDSYVEERKAHVRYFVQFSIDIGKAVCVLDPVEAEARDTAMKAAMDDPSLAPPPVPHPSLGAGVWVPSQPGAGQLSRQGIVRVAGTTGRLDALMGQGWHLLGYGRDPRTMLTSAQREQLARLDVRTIVLGALGTPCDAEDVDGFYKTWFDECGVDAILIRPDRYVAAAAPEKSLQSSFAAVMDSLHLEKQLA